MKDQGCDLKRTKLPWYKVVHLQHQEMCVEIMVYCCEADENNFVARFGALGGESVRVLSEPVNRFLWSNFDAASG
jgi:hypothetical protein